MGRRSSHTPEELRRLIVGATRGIVEKKGLAELSAREIARAIGYSAGTIYNVFKNLDELLLTVQVEMLDDAVLRLSGVPKDCHATDYLDQIASNYIDFALENSRLWNLLFQHQVPPSAPVPTHLHDNVNKLIELVKTGLAPLMPGSKPEAIDRAARVLWAGVHGITAIAVTQKSPTMTPLTAQTYVRAFIDTYTAGLRATGR